MPDHPTSPETPDEQRHNPNDAIWALDPDATYLNHGSFGACPNVILQRQSDLRKLLETQPVQFFIRTATALLDESRQTLADHVGVSADDLVFVPNATTGVNAVLRSLQFEPGDEILLTNHNYNACRNVVHFVAKRSGARPVIAEVPFPTKSNDQITKAVMDKVTPRTKLALLDHVTSPTALVFPIQALVARLAEQGIDTLVDGAHAPGMLPLSLDEIGAAYYTGNCHKWLCTPKGAGFLHIRKDRQTGIEPTTVSHGYNTARLNRPRLHDAFDWVGTVDPTPWCCVGDAISWGNSLLPDGWSDIMRQNHALVVTGREILLNALAEFNKADDSREQAVGQDVEDSEGNRVQRFDEASCPTEMLGSIATVLLPRSLRGRKSEQELSEGKALGDETSSSEPSVAALQEANSNPDEFDRSTSPTPTTRLAVALWDRYRIEVPIFHWPRYPQRVLRISAQQYNTITDYEKLAAALVTLLREGM